MARAVVVFKRWRRPIGTSSIDAIDFLQSGSPPISLFTGRRKGTDGVAASGHQRRRMMNCGVGTAAVDVPGNRRGPELRRELAGSRFIIGRTQPALRSG